MKKSFFFCLFFVLSSSVAFAQLLSDERAMYDRMDRLERDITLLQRKIYKSSGEKIASVNEDTSAFAQGSLNHLYMKIDGMEQTVSSLTGQIEELSHELAVIKEEQKKISMDTDLRIAELEKKLAAEEKKVKDQKNKKEKTLLPVKNQQNKKENTNTKQIYDEAYRLLSEQKYAEAQIALEDFVEKYPKDSFAGNAQYWLGETFYVRELYELAAVAFAKGVKEYKDSSKGADSLFKLGMTMEKLNKNKEACTAFKNVKKEFPQAADVLLSKTQKEIEKLGCNK